MVLIAGKENSNVDDIITSQAENKKQILYGVLYSAPDIYYKYHSVLRRRPEVIVAGSSRVLKFRDKFFNDDVRFFNAGRIADKLAHVSRFIDWLPANKTPKIMILGMDSWWFQCTPFEENLGSPDNPPSLGNIFSEWLTVYKYCVINRFNLKSLFTDTYHDGKTRIGVRALFYNTGYRNDGSLNEDGFASDPYNRKYGKDHTFSSFMASLQNPKNRYDTVCQASLDELKNLLEKCKSRNIQVIGYLTPVVDTGYRYMVQHHDRFGGFFQFARFSSQSLCFLRISVF